MWQQYHIVNELSHYGIVVEQFNPLDFSSNEEANEKLLNRIKRNDIDFFMTPHNEEKLFFSTLDIINSKSIPSLLICFDNLVVPYSHKRIASRFELVWLTSVETQPLFESWGANTIFLPYAANPFVFKPSNNLDNGKVCFIGTPYGSRINTVNALTKNSIKIDLYSGLKNSIQISKFASSKRVYMKPFFNLIRFECGRTIIKGAIKQSMKKHALFDGGFINFRPPVPLDDIASLYSDYSLSVSSTTARNTGVLANPLPIVNLRSFEIPMSGGLQICQYNDELAGYFEEGKELIFYRSDEDFVDKVRFYLDDSRKQLRREMKINARERAIREHSWKCRFDKIFSKLSIEQPWFP